MISTDTSKPILEITDLSVFFEVEHYEHQAVREIFISAITHPIHYFFSPREVFFVLDGINLKIEKGMRIGILGVNGSGKTTLCRCIAGMIVAQKGKIESNADIRAIFDIGNGIMPELTGKENAQLLARLFYPNEKDMNSIVDEALEFSELGHFVDVPFKKYSKGMQSRLLLSLISAKTADLLILDEVFDGADIFFQKKLSVRMKNLIKNTGATVFVSHSPDQIREICNHVIVLNKGKISFQGPVEDGIEYYLNSSL